MTAEKKPLKNPEISVIVPVYKVEKYLNECIDSILAQTFTDFEVILVDDGSPDNCPAMCDAAAERGIGRRTVGFGKCPPRGDARLALRRLFCGGVHRLFPPHGGRRKVVQNHPAKIYKYNKRCGRKMQGFQRKCGCRFWADLV